MNTKIIVVKAPMQLRSPKELSTPYGGRASSRRGVPASGGSTWTRSGKSLARPGKYFRTETDKKASDHFPTLGSSFEGLGQNVGPVHNEDPSLLGGDTGPG